MTSDIEELAIFSNKIRKSCLDMALSAGKAGCHVGGGFSSIELFAVLFGAVLNVDPKNPCDENRDRFIASKAHCILPHFSTLVLKGFVDREKFMSMALNARRKNLPYKTYVLLGDGESNEGAVWEAFMSAPHFKLDNLVAIVDYNNMQFDGPCSEIMGMEPLDERLRAFGWETLRVDGHNIAALLEAFSVKHDGKPLAIVADTVKARGIPGLENKAESHHATLTQEMYDAVVADMEGGRYGRV